MIVVTNEKVAGFSPRWAPFAGFSLLFDNPGQSLSPMGADLLKLNAPVETETAAPGDGLQLYRRFAVALNELGLDLLTNRYLFCPLPAYSYHVTVWDGLNASHVARISAEIRPDFERFLGQMPRSFVTDRTFTLGANDSALVRKQDWHITFRFDKLVKWDNIGLVGLVVPADADSERQLQRIIVARKSLYARFEKRFKLSMSSSFMPHISLGYFANKEQAELTTNLIDGWNDLLKREVAESTIRYRSISLYGFTDMITFFKRNLESNDG